MVCLVLSKLTVNLRTNPLHLTELWCLANDVMGPGIRVAPSTIIVIDIRDHSRGKSFDGKVLGVQRHFDIETVFGSGLKSAPIGLS